MEAFQLLTLVATLMIWGWFGLVLWLLLKLTVWLLVQLALIIDESIT